MPLTHRVPNARDLNISDLWQLINTMFERAEHPGISQFRTGNVATGLLDLSLSVTFGVPLPSGFYEVFFQPRASLSVQMWASALTPEGFTFNLSAGVNGVFSYLAVES